VADLVEGLARNARAIAETLGQIDGAEVLNEVVFTQVLVSFGDGETTRAVTDAVIADGTTWMSGSGATDALLRDLDAVAAELEAALEAANPNE